MYRKHRRRYFRAVLTAVLTAMVCITAGLWVTCAAAETSVASAAGEVEHSYLALNGNPDYTVSVPEQITVGGEAAKIIISGGSKCRVTVGIPDSVELMCGETSLYAQIFGETVTKEMNELEALGSISAAWENETDRPKLGIWNGTVSYSCSAEVSQEGVLRSWSEEENRDFHTEALKQSVTGAEFLAEMPDLSGISASDKWDVSEAGDGSVMAWVTDNRSILHLAAEGGVTANADSSYLFKGFGALKYIHFGSAFHNQETNVMTDMFSGCVQLAEVSVGSDFVFHGMDGRLPVPNPEYIPGADGNWYNGKGQEFTVYELPDKKEDTYFAVDKSRMLMEGPAFNAVVPDEAASVVFTDETAPSGALMLDVSDGQNMGVVAWMDGTEFMVSTQRRDKKVLANPNSGEMFMNKAALTAVDFSCFDTRHAEAMIRMFYNCGKLQNVDVSDFDTKHVTTMRHMFQDCKSLSSLDVSNFDTSKVTDMVMMFYGLRGVPRLDVSHFETENVKEMNWMFAYCASLTDIDLSHFHTNNVQRMDYMFTGCEGLTSLDLSGFETESLNNMSAMFSDCINLTEIRMENFNTSKVTNMSSIFFNCGLLQRLDLSNFDTGSLGYSGTMGMFYHCYALAEVKLGSHYDWVGKDPYLPMPSSAYIAGADGYWYSSSGKAFGETKFRVIRSASIMHQSA